MKYLKEKFLEICIHIHLHFYFAAEDAQKQLASVLSNMRSNMEKEYRSSSRYFEDRD